MDDLEKVARQQINKNLEAIELMEAEIEYLNEKIGQRLSQVSNWEGFIVEIQPELPFGGGI